MLDLIPSSVLDEILNWAETGLARRNGGDPAYSWGRCMKRWPPPTPRRVLSSSRVCRSWHRASLRWSSNSSWPSSLPQRSSSDTLGDACWLGRKEKRGLGPGGPSRARPLRAAVGTRDGNDRLRQAARAAGCRGSSGLQSRRVVKRPSPRPTPRRRQACSRSGRPSRHSSRRRARSRCRARHRPCSCP
jgi:hypothetical protein